jgi:hypothetical protein
MKTHVVAILSVLLLSAPALAVESRAECAVDPATATLAADVADKLPASLVADRQPVPESFHLSLTCLLLDSGMSAAAIAALTTEELLDRAVDGVTHDRSRADALLAILQAMKQATVVRPEPQVVK